MSGTKRLPDTYSNDIHKWCFPSILEPYQGKLHLLLEEEAADRRKQKTVIQAVEPIKKNEWQIISVHRFAWKLEHIITNVQKLMLYHPASACARHS